MYQRKDKLWQDQLPVPGTKRYKYFYGKTKSEVKAKMAAWKAEQDKPMLFKDAADAWDTRHSGKVTHNAHDVYVAPLRRANDYFADIPIAEITPDQIQAFIQHIADQGFSKRSVQIHKNMLNMIFNHAIVQPGSLVRFNPCNSVSIPSGLPQVERKPPTDKQLELVSPNAESEMGLFAFFLLYTGLRRGELLALRWEDIDRKNKLIHVRREVIYESNQPTIVDRAKTPAGVRKVELLDKLEAQLPEGKKGLVFGGDTPLTKTQMRKNWLAFCKEIGEVEITEEKHYSKSNNRTYIKHSYKPKMTPHQFRHAYASMLDDAEIDDNTAKSLLGHKSIVTTKNVYTKLREAKRQRSTKKLNDYISGLDKSE